MAELIRRSIDALLAHGGELSPEDAYRRAAQAAGKHRSGLKDVSARHDDYLREGYAR